MTAVMVATNGGHLAQLVELSDRMAGLGDERHWVTFDSPQSRSLLAGRMTTFIRPIEERDVPGVLRGVGDAWRILRDTRATAVVSTGSAIALSFLPLAAARGIPAHYVESSARVQEPSLTGRTLAKVPGVRLYRQYPHAAKGRWRYAGSVFEGYERRDGEPRAIRRAVVTFGSGTHGFRRLLDRLVRIIPKDVDVLWQTGSTDVAGLDIRARDLVPAAELDQAIRDADVVIAHAGCGSALAALNAGRLPVLVPREPQHRELVDNHQVELAGWLSSSGLAIRRSPETLTYDDLVEAASGRVGRRANPPPLRLVA
jgi:UDP-N-acetylglucosamine--N-acetylmuramyl-(pentapeptide) pyrophosphoryl-undecaprenol N-acetylglucosamine transferase